MAEKFDASSTITQTATNNQNPVLIQKNSNHI